MQDQKESVEAFPTKGDAKKQPATREIKNTAIVDDVSPIDSDAGRRRNSTMRAMTGFEKKFYEWLNKVIEKYYEYVTFKQETLLMLLTLISFPALSASLPLLDSIVFYNNAYGFGLKIITMAVGLIAIYAADMINCRHAMLSTMVLIVNGEATIRDVCDVIKGKGKNMPLIWTAYIFCGCLVAAELSITSIPHNSYYGQGKALEADLQDAATRNYTLDNFQAAVGAQIGCYNCVGLRSRDVLYVPISDKLVNGGGLQRNSEVIMESVQDIISLDVSCFVVTPTPRPLDTNLQANVLGFNYGVQTAFMDIEISSFDAQNVLRARRCTFISRDWSGITKVRYKIADSGATSRQTVEFVGPTNPKTCGKIGDVCLNQALHTDISVSLIKAAFPRPVFSIDKAYSQNFQMFPDPGRAVSDADYGDLVANAIGMNFLLGVAQFPTLEKTTALETDQVAVRLQMQSWLTILTIVSASVCTFIAIIIIVADVLRLGKTADVILRKLSQTLQPGKGNVEAIAEYISDILKDGAPPDKWDLAPVRYGEDRKTMMDPVGKLRFGGKKDIVKFKPGRPYY